MTTQPSVDQIALAALLHDIGKFSQRAGVQHDSRYGGLSRDDYGENGAHAKWSADFVRAFVDDPVVEDLVLYHHHPTAADNPTAARIIQRADHLSSAVDRKPREGKGDPEKDLLLSVFPSVHLDGVPVPPSRSRWSHLLRPLSLEREGTFPTTGGEPYLWKNEPAYKSLWNDFAREYRAAGRPPAFGTALALLRKYTSLIPSATYVNVPDVPLYDHARTTAALAVCLTLGEKDNPFLLVQGDLSGIQSFIFGVATPQDARKGMAKRLRGRSFWLGLLTDAAARAMVRAAGGTEAGILWNTGGNFLLLLPNTRETREAVDRIGRTVNAALLQKYGGTLSLAVGHLPCSEEEMKDFSSLTDRLNAIIGRKKVQKFIDCDPVFRAHGKVYEIADLCPVCGLPLTPGGACPECRTHEDLGTAIARARYLLRGPGLRFSFEDFGLAAAYDLSDSPDPAPDRAVIAINPATDFLVDGAGESGFMYLGNTVPLSRAGILTVGDLAHLAGGDQKIGIFKADVDRLGRIMASGLPRDDRSISRVYTLSTRLEYFFAGYLNTLCREFGVYRMLCPECREHAREITVPDEDDPTRSAVFYEWTDPAAQPCPDCMKRFVPSLYVIFSGGDDLLVLGPWDHILRFAQRVQEEFAAYVCANPAITISAGIAVVPPQLPVAVAVEAAEKCLERAKKDGRNRIVIFGESLPWQDNGYEKGYSTLMRSGMGLEASLNESVITRSFIHTINALWDDTFADLGDQAPDRQCNERTRRKRYLPYLKYQLARNVRANGTSKTRDDIERLIVPIFGWAHLPLTWTILRTRRM